MVYHAAHTSSKTLCHKDANIPNVRRTLSSNWANARYDNIICNDVQTWYNYVVNGIARALFYLNDRSDGDCFGIGIIRSKVHANLDLICW